VVVGDRGLRAALGQLAAGAAVADHRVTRFDSRRSSLRHILACKATVDGLAREL
jgi:hypothetical protein